MDRLPAERKKKKNTEIERNTHLFLSISQAMTVKNMRFTVSKLENSMVHDTDFSNLTQKLKDDLNLL